MRKLVNLKLDGSAHTKVSLLSSGFMFLYEGTTHKDWAYSQRDSHGNLLSCKDAVPSNTRIKYTKGENWVGQKYMYCRYVKVLRVERVF